MNMLDCEMKHKYIFALHSFLPAAFGSETEQATKGNIILNWSWIHQKSSVWALVLDTVVTIHLRSDKAISHQFQLSRTGIYPLYRLQNFVTSYSIQFCFFSPSVFVDHWKCSQKQFVKTDQNPWCVYTLLKQYGLFSAFCPAHKAYRHLEQNNRQL